MHDIYVNSDNNTFGEKSQIYKTFFQQSSQER